MVETFNISTSIQNFFVTNNFEILHLSDVILKDFFHLFFSATSKEEILGSIMKPLHSDNTTEICFINSSLLFTSFLNKNLTHFVENIIFRNVEQFFEPTHFIPSQKFWSLCGLLRKQVFLHFKKRLYCHCTSKRVGRLFKSLHTSAPFSPSSNSQWNYIIPVLFEHVKTFTRFVCTTITFLRPPCFGYFFIKSSQIPMKNGNYLHVQSLTRKCHFPFQI